MKEPRFIALLTNPFIIFFYFLFLGLFSLILVSQLSLTQAMQAIAIYVLLSLVSSILILSKTPKMIKTLISLIGLLPVILFIYFLIFLTGGLSSPFLILTHFFAIALAFLLSPNIAVSFVISTLTLVLVNLGIDPSSKQFLTQTPFAAFLYLFGYIAIIPFGYLLAREYKVKEEWAKILEQQIATSKTQEEELLKNITDAVLVVDPKLCILYLNQPATKLLKYGNEILGQNLFKFFYFKDKEGRTQEPYSLPFAETLTSKMQTKVDNIQISTKDKEFISIDMKILPALSSEGPLGLILILKDRSLKSQKEREEENVAEIALGKFISIITKQKQIFLNFEKVFSEKTPAQILIKENRELERLAKDFIYAQELESGGIGALSSLVDIGKIIEDLILEENQSAQENSVLFVPKTKKREVTLQPKDSQKVKTEKRIFPLIYIPSNAAWLHDSLQKIFDLSCALAQKNTNIEVDVLEEGSLAKIQVEFFPSKTDLKPESLFEKFYQREEISQTTGLEGFIAKSLIERMGGNIKVEKPQNPPVLQFIITFGKKEKDEEKIS